jgi:glycosyltransferase involved in cell wall biosynthesis
MFNAMRSFKADSGTSFEKAREIVRTKTLLVLSDAYPPFTKGGAEVSLSLVLARLPAAVKSKAIVVVFDVTTKDVNLETVDGIDVLQLPGAARWPFWHLSHKQLVARVNRLRFGWKAHDYIFGLQYALSDTSPLQKLKALILSVFHSPKGGMPTDHLLDAKHHNVAVLSGLLKGNSLQLLLCDNTRSILAGSLLLERGLGARSIAVVRDNRFHCVRHSQSQLVAGRQCKSCSFGCAKEDASRWPALQAELMKAVSRKRIAALQSFDHVVVTSHHLSRFIVPLLDAKQVMHRIPNCFGEEAFVSSVIRGVAETAYDDLLVIGMLNENKGQLEFITKSAKWLTKHPQRRVLLCGTGDRIARRILDFAKKNNIADQVRLLGYKDRTGVFEEIRKCKLVLAPTRWPEPFGRVPLEAGIARRPIVAFGIGGLTETIINRKTGILVKPGDYDAFLREVDYLLERPTERLAMGLAARQHVLQWYGPDQTVAKLTELIGSLLKRPHDRKHGFQCNSGVPELSAAE